jgi:predicted enzyme related to lactoylglutathione lyase
MLGPLEVTSMPIRNAFASVAVRDIDAAARWYEALLGRAGRRPMPGLVEWSFDGGGGLQVYVAPDRAGQCSCTLAVSALDDEVARLPTGAVRRTEAPGVRTAMIADPDGNSIALAEATDPGMLR